MSRGSFMRRTRAEADLASVRNPFVPITMVTRRSHLRLEPVLPLWYTLLRPALFAKVLIGMAPERVVVSSTGIETDCCNGE